MKANTHMIFLSLSIRFFAVLDKNSPAQSGFASFRTHFYFTGWCKDILDNCEVDFGPVGFRKGPGIHLRAGELRRITSDAVPLFKSVDNKI